MTTFSAIIVKCPHCGLLMSDYELMSYTVHSAEYWSDGKTGAGIPSMTRIGICAECKGVFWKDEAKLPGETDWEAQEGLASVLDIHDLDWRFDDDRDIKKIEFYKELLDPKYSDKEENEFYVRTQIWWSINDLVRNLASWRIIRNAKMLAKILKHRRENKKLFHSYNKLYNENLDRLIFLLIKGADVDLLYLANMYRERANFRKAKEILEKVEKKSGSWRQVKRKVRCRDRKVFKL